jgi:hypothetical protein
VSAGDAVFRRIQSVARSAAAKSGTGAPTQEYLIRHTLESFLDRLTRTSHAGDFVLKGGVLLGAYGVRRPIKDADANALRADVTAEHLTYVVRDIAAIDVDDGVVFDLDTAPPGGVSATMPETSLMTDQCLAGGESVTVRTTRRWSRDPRPGRRLHQLAQHNFKPIAWGEVLGGTGCSCFKEELSNACGH